jgi:hypothetical protein
MHDATQLHYDFRLEMEGVLKSWAVPKGRRSIGGQAAGGAGRHPVSYFDFETFGEQPAPER